MSPTATGYSVQEREFLIIVPLMPSPSSHSSTPRRSQSSERPPSRNGATSSTDRYVGTIVGESTSREFRLALAHEAVREQDIIAADADLRRPSSYSDGDVSSGNEELIRVWAKVQRIERLNPLFPSEAGHELAETRTDPFDTVLSLSREMVTAVCQVLGSEPRTGDSDGKLDHLRYPPRPASSAYRPETADIARVVLGDLQQKKNRALDIATLANRPEVDVLVDGHAIVLRHLAILAMTGAGKSTAARRVIEELAKKNYPIVIFDPRGDYTGLSKVPALKGKVRRYYAQFPVFNEDADRVAEVVSALGYELTGKMQTFFGDLYRAGKSFLADENERAARVKWLATQARRDTIQRFGVLPNMYLLANLAEAAENAVREDDEEAKNYLRDLGWDGLSNNKKDADTLSGIKTRTYKAANALQRMEQTNRTMAETEAEPLPTDRKELIRYGQISVVSLAGYTGDFQATIYSIIADDLFQARMRDEVPLPALMLLEEAHNFAPGNASSAAEKRAIGITRQIAQEGRKFGMGLLMISQRPSRLDETALSMCNSHIIMRMVNPNDQAYIRKVIESLGQEEARMLPDLDTGEALLSGQMINFPVLAKIKEPESKGEREEGDAFDELEKAKMRWQAQEESKQQRSHLARKDTGKNNGQRA